MSIFSGFPTRKLQDRYNSLIKSTFNLLMQIIVAHVDSDKISSFEKSFKKLYINFGKLDAIKHSEIKISQILQPLANHLCCLEECQNLSQMLRSPKKQIKNRTHTCNFLVKSQGESSQKGGRKTINLGSYLQARNTKNRYCKTKRNSLPAKFSTEEKKRSHQDVSLSQDISEDISMEELMEKNRLVERKMSFFRKKMFNQKGRIVRIQQVEGEGEEEDLNAT